jgi:hypothetical protein
MLSHKDSQEITNSTKFFVWSIVELIFVYLYVIFV